MKQDEWRRVRAWLLQQLTETSKDKLVSAFKSGKLRRQLTEVIKHGETSDYPKAAALSYDLCKAALEDIGITLE